MRDIIQGTIDSIHEAIDEADKTASVKRIERVLGVIDPKILEAEVITDLEDLRSAIADYRGITRAGLTPEEYQDEKEAAFDAITEAVEGLDIDEDALESLEAPVKETWQMTRKEFIKQDFERYRRDAKALGFSLNEQLQIKLSGEQHEKTVRKALSIGKPVPPEVLKDYPDLVSPVKTRREQIMEFDYAHSLDELKRMAREKGISPSGTKHEIIGRLM